MPTPTPLSSLALAAALLASAGAARAQTFTRVLDPAIVAAPDSASAASWIDADGDGDLDLFVTTWSSKSPNLLFLNDGLGVFTRATIPAIDASLTEAFGSSWADADGDGRPDLFVSQLFNGGGLLLANGAGLAFAPVAGPPSGAAIKGNASWADIDLDGDPDLVLACLNGTGGITTPNRLFVNQGGFVFTERDTGMLVTTVDTHHTASWADYDDDGDPDLFFATGGVGSSKRDRLYRNMQQESGVAWFQPIGSVSLATDFHDSQQLSWADVDNDGDLDCYVINYTTFPNMLYRNDGGGAFTRLSGIGPIVTDAGNAHGCAWGDFDNDGDLDVYVARDAGQTNRYYRNDGATWTSVTTGDFVTRSSSDWSAVAGDMDRDGDLDLFVPIRSPASAGLLYRNDLTSGAHWIELRLTGVVSNRSALGARVRVKATIGGAPRWQTREVATGTSYGGHSMLDVHFGFGDATVCDSIEIRWPSGIRQVLTTVPANQVLSVLEDASTPVHAANVVARVRGGRVELEWAVDEAGARAAIERSVEAGVWSERGAAVVDVGGRVRFSEEAPPGASRAGWRLRFDDGGIRTTAGEVWIELGGAEGRAFTLRTSGGLGGGEPLRARLSLPRAGEVVVEVVDLQGRRIEARRLALEAGEHAVPLTAPRYAGIYWLRATHDGVARMVKAVRLE